MTMLNRKHEKAFKSRESALDFVVDQPINPLKKFKFS